MRTILFFMLLSCWPVILSSQGNIGVGTITPEHPFQVNVDSIWTDTIVDYVDTPHPALTPGLAITPGSQKGAQRFPVGQTGFLSAIKFYFAFPTNATQVLIEVFHGQGPEGALLTSGTLNNVTIGVFTLHFAQPWSWVTEGDTLNVVMSPLSGASCKWKQGLYAPPDTPPFLAFHYTGSWDTIPHSLSMTAFITYTDTVIHQVLKVKEDKRVMVNNYNLPPFDGNTGDVMASDGNGNLSWSSPNALSLTVLSDTDNDTKVEVEAVADDDKIRMSVAGQPKMIILPSGKVGLNTVNPVSDLDIRGDHNANDGGELQLATPSMTNFIRMFGGRTGDPNPFIAFSDQDHFHFVSTSSDWLTFTRRLTISPSGNIGIGTDQPAARLQVNEGAVLFKGPAANLPATPADPPASGAGTRMMWYPDKAAFRVGRVLGTEWDKDSIGQYSFAGGIGNKAKGIFGFVGSGEGGNHAIGTHSFVGNGRDNIASGNYAFIGSGHDHYATGHASFVGGGGGNSATGEYAVVTGGSENIASGNYSFIGSGPGLYARSFAENVFGSYATDYTPVSATAFADPDRLFVIGNGTSNANRKDALIVYKNGAVGVGVSSPTHRFQIESSSSSTQHILRAKSNYTGNQQIRAVEGISAPANGFGVGGHFTGGFRGVQAFANGGVSGGTIMAVEGSTTGTAGTTIGVYGAATGGATRWAGFFGDGNVYVTNQLRIGTGAQFINSGYKLLVDGKIIAEEVRVQLSEDWPDYVFDADYQLLTLAEVEHHILHKKHLPGIPAAQEVKEHGLALGDMQRRMMEKIEELTLYILEQNKRIIALENTICELQEKH